MAAAAMPTIASFNLFIAALLVLAAILLLLLQGEFKRARNRASRRGLSSRRDFRCVTFLR
jgi:hypothetical protein